MSNVQFLQLLYAGKMAVDERGIAQQPEVLGGLEFGHAEFRADMPAGAVEDEDNLLGGPGAGRVGERLEFHLEDVLCASPISESCPGVKDALRNWRAGPRWARRTLTWVVT